VNSYETLANQTASIKADNQAEINLDNKEENRNIL
jgi:hypothetical protein